MKKFLVFGLFYMVSFTAFGDSIQWGLTFGGQFPLGSGLYPQPYYYPPEQQYGYQPPSYQQQYVYPQFAPQWHCHNGIIGHQHIFNGYMWIDQPIYGQVCD